MLCSLVGLCLTLTAHIYLRKQEENRCECSWFSLVNLKV